VGEDPTATESKRHTVLQPISVSRSQPLRRREPRRQPCYRRLSGGRQGGQGGPRHHRRRAAGAIAKRFGDVESGEIAQGAFGGASPRPEESLATIFVTYRLMARRTMPDLVAGEVARNLMLAKARLSPLASRIETPDADEDTVPIHPGASAFYNDEQTSIFDRFESLFWMGSALLSIVGSLVAWALSGFGARSKNPSDFGARLLEILREAREPLRARRSRGRGRRRHRRLVG
jgi:hypothetical protein